jgi:hypothetical protein
MNYIVLILGSTTLVAGGTAITSQQDARNNVIAHQFLIQQNASHLRGEHRQVGVPECEDAGIFSDIAHPIDLSCIPFGQNLLFDVTTSHSLDLDGDGEAETIIGDVNSYKNEWGEYHRMSMVLHADDSTSFGARTLLSAHPDDLTYKGIPDLGDYYESRRIGYLDVTGDGLVDVLLGVGISGGPIQYFYVENLSPPPTAACTTDVNNDGSTNVNDLLAVVGNWGPCE